MIGRVARRIWSVAMRDRYGANERSQKLKYHIQTSGRSLHAQEIQFNDIRTTLQALLALQDNCNSLHTNAYDEAITTPTEESVRRAMAIQLICTKELGWLKNENALQGSCFVTLPHRRRRERRARRVPAHQRPRRRAGRDGDAVPARQDPGGEPLLRAPQALRRAADRRREHVPARGRRRPARRSVNELTPRHARGEAAASRRPADFQGRHAARGAGGAGAPEGGRARRAATSSPS